MSNILPAAAYLLDKAARVRKLEIAEEHKHDACMLLYNEMRVLETIHSLEPQVIFINIPSKPAN
jgi:hypothetical protein